MEMFLLVMGIDAVRRRTRDAFEVERRRQPATRGGDAGPQETRFDTNGLSARVPCERTAIAEEQERHAA